MKKVVSMKRWFLFYFLSLLFTVPGNLSYGMDDLSTVVLLRVHEPRENAFSMLVPKGWQTAGGIFRVDPTAQGGPSQSIAAKLDFAVMKDQQGTVMARWLPDMLYFDSSMSPAGQMGLFPPGSNYAGMTVYPKMTAIQYIDQIVIPYAHPQATGLKITDQRNLPDLAQKIQQRVQAAIPGMTFYYNVALKGVTYWESGIQYEEKLFTIIEDWGQLGSGMWGNKDTFLMRAPIGELSATEPLFSLIRDSVIIDRQWLSGELRGQMQRIQTVREVQKNIQQIEQDIVEHRRKTNAEIHNDMFLTLTSQEEYVNPFTNEIETGSNQWQHRWVNPAGEVIYTNDETYDPRIDANLNRSDFQRTPVRKRFE